jgi:hypothetical protein
MTRWRDGQLFSQDYTLRLTNDELRALMRPINPSSNGGHQSFEKRLQDRVQGRTLTVSEDELEKAYRYGYGYGTKGTWQNYMKAVVKAGLRAGWKPR